MLIRGLLLFWAIWFSLVFASNLADGLRELGLLAPDWRFASGNFALIVESVGRYSLSRAWAAALFSGVIANQLAAAILFFRATREYGGSDSNARPKIVAAFSVGIGFFAALLIADEIFMVYRAQPSLEGGHFQIFCALLLSLIVSKGPATLRE